MYQLVIIGSKLIKYHGMILLENGNDLEKLDIVSVQMEEAVLDKDP